MTLRALQTRFLAASWAFRLPKAGPISVDELSRRVYVTSFRGSDGNAGHIVTVEGSPPRGIYVVVGSDSALHPYVNVIAPFGRTHRCIPETTSLGKNLVVALRDLVDWVRTEDDAMVREMERIAENAANRHPGLPGN